MSETLETVAAKLTERFGERVRQVPSCTGELTIEVSAGDWRELSRALRDEFAFEMLMDLCAVDYLAYGVDEWKGQRASGSGFSRGVNRGGPRAPAPADRKRFAVVIHLQSIANNLRIRARTFCENDDAPIVDSLIDVWASADWYEREAFDLFGILFDGHPDMRRLLTDYGFIGHPFRKDFPLTGNVEVRYDPERGRVVYQPVSIEPRTLVPRVIRDDNRYDPALKESSADG